MKDTARVVRFIGVVAMLIAIGFFVQYTIRHIQDIPPLHWGATLVVVWLMCLGLYIITIAVMGCVWMVFVREMGVILPLLQLQSLFGIAQFGKYIPGNFGQHLGRVVLAREAGMPVVITVRIVILELLLGVGVAAGLAFLSLLFLRVPFVEGLTSVGQLTFILLSSIAFVFPWVSIRFVNDYFPALANRLSAGEKLHEPKLRTMFIAIVLFVVCFVLMGLILELQSRYFFGVTGVSMFELTGLFAVAWLAGYLTPGAPGGLGIRETMMVLLLSPIVGSGVAVGLGVTLRVTTTLGDGIAFLVGLFLRFRLDRVKRMGD